MKILLDTCAIIWVISDPEKLSKKAKKAVTNSDHEVVVSPISCAEIACLSEKNKIILDRHWKLWFRHFAEENAWEVLPITLPIVEESYSLPGRFHPDPADRIITATARLFNASVITSDKKMRDYAHVSTIW